jgi:hypothetical protein
MMGNVMGVPQNMGSVQGAATEGKFKITATDHVQVQKRS